MRKLMWMIGLGLVVAAVLAALPGVWSGSNRNPVAQIISFRGGLAALGLAGALGWGLIAWVRRRSQGSTAGSSATRSTGGRRIPVLTTCLALACAVFAVINLGLLASRGLDPSARISWQTLATRTAAPTDVTVLALNTLWNAVPPATMADYIGSASAQVVAMPEAEKKYAMRVADELRARGRGDWQVFATESPWPNAMLVSPAMGEYRLTTTDIRGLIMADPVNGRGPRLMTVHATPPAKPWPLDTAQSRRYLAMWWQRTTSQISAEVRKSDHLIAAGDFNSTPDHPGLDFGDQLNAMDGAGGWGTWPSALPAWAGAPIDHIVVDKSHWQVTGRWVLDVPDSDHRALVARLSPRS